MSIRYQSSIVGQTLSKDERVHEEGSDESLPEKASKFVLSGMVRSYFSISSLFQVFMLSPLCVREVRFSHICLFQSHLILIPHPFLLYPRIDSCPSQLMDEPLFQNFAPVRIPFPVGGISLVYTAGHPFLNTKGWDKKGNSPPCRLS
ncbi:hypothetical protein CEXT_595731 [Caerostris extrusa]|uniref:Uncharacterized protein n=1 Tax=Caerostris extrusa TaxID=172846 RepID=A0AAV4XYZ8_CAEEX|nr:hypothetical protein CEXT_595731 [Caerostris extrusa]